MTPLEMLWFPVLSVVAVTAWIIFAIMGSMNRRKMAGRGGSVTVRLPEGANIVRNDGTNLDN